MTNAHYKLELVEGGLPKPHRADRSKPSDGRYAPLLEQLYLAVDWFDADPENWVSVAKFGGKGTAGTTKKNIQNGEVRIPEPPEGYVLSLATRVVDEVDENGGAIRSRLYARLDKADVTTVVDADDGEVAEVVFTEDADGFAEPVAAAKATS